MFIVDDNLMAALVTLQHQLRTNMKTVAVAESCTGGLIQALLTELPNSSEVFQRGWTVYSVASKMEELSVPLSCIEKYGVYSDQTAQAMALGARRNSGAHYGVGVTGVAGPESDGGWKAGTVFVSISHGKTFTGESYEIFNKPRAVVRWEAAISTIMLLLEATKYF